MLLPPHLTRYPHDQYHGWPVMAGYTMLTPYLDREYNVLQRQLQDYPRTFAVRIDLRFPPPYSPGDGRQLGNEYLQRFFYLLELSIERDQNLARREGKRVRPAGSRNLWCREYDQDYQRPHFHLVLLFNRDAFHTVGHLHSGQRNMADRIKQAWADTLGLPSCGIGGLVEFPDNCFFNLTAHDQPGLGEFFRRISYMCKAESKWFGDGYHCYGGSKR